MRPALLTALLMLVLQPAALRGQIPRLNPGIIAVEAESLLNSSIATHGGVSRQNMLPFGPGWGRNEQLFWSVGQIGAQLRLTFKTAVTGRYQVFLLFTRAPDYAFARASFDGAPFTSFNGYAPTVSRDSAFLGMLDLTPGLRELLVEVARKDGKSTGLYVGLDRIELRPVAARSGGMSRTSGVVEQIGRPAGRATQPQTTARVAESQKQSGTVQVGQVVIAGARLAFALFTGDGPKAKLGAIETTVYRPDLTVSLTWQANDGGKLGYRWQMASQPFPSGLGVSATPPGLLGEGTAALDQLRSFKISLGNFPPLATSSATSTASAGATASNRSAANSVTGFRSSRTAPAPSSSGTAQAPGGIHLPDHPVDFYIRIIPIFDGKPFGSPSNTAIAHFQPGAKHDYVADEFAFLEERKKHLAEMAKQASMYEISLVEFKPMIFVDPERWGCVYVINNPYEKQPLHDLFGYSTGPHCGDIYTGEGDTPDVWDVVTGWAKALDIVSGFYDDAKSFVADKIAGLVPCPVLGNKLASECKDLAKGLASTAISAGLIAAGVPPTIPDMQGLGDAAKGKVVDAAVDYSCGEFEAHGGQCTPAMRKTLEAAYQEAVNRIQEGLIRETKEPGCGNTALAHENGREPLPCFTKYPGTEVRPATGAVTELPSMTIRVKRVKPNPPFPMPGCRLRADLDVTNYFPGAVISGVEYKKTPLSGRAFDSAVSAVPPLSVGSTVDVTLAFTRITPFYVPGHHGGIGWFDWQYLYRGGLGTLSLSLQTIAPVAGATEFNGTDVTLACGTSVQSIMQLPK